MSDSVKEMSAISETAEVSKPAPPLGMRIFHFLISMKLALTLLFIIAILSIIGTIIPQGEEALQSDWVKNPLYNFYNFLGLFNMYTSWWFMSLLTLLMANLSVCILNRLPTTVKHAFKLRLDVKDAFVANQPEAASFEGAGEKGMGAARDLLKGSRYRLHAGESGSVLAQKGRFSGLSSLMFHLSFLVICIGAISGAVFGFQERLDVPDGATINVPNTDYQLKSYGFNMKSDPVYDGNRIVSYRPSLYSTDLQVLDGGQQVVRQTITVNGPLRLTSSFLDLLKVEGTNFYQSSYYQSSRGYVSVIEISRRPGKTLIYLGFAMMMVGITIGLYFPHRRIWLKIGKSDELLMGGRTNRSKLGFKRDFERITAELRLRLGQEARADG